MYKNHNGDYVLSPAEVYDLREFVLDTLSAVNYDDTGVTDDLAEGAERAAEILGLRTRDVTYENEASDDE